MHIAFALATLIVAALCTFGAVTHWTGGSRLQATLDAGMATLMAVTAANLMVM